MTDRGSCASWKCSKALLGAVALALVQGCASFSSYETPATLGAGRIAVGGHVAVQAGAGVCTACPFIYEPLSGPQPQIDAVGAYGLTDWLDVRVGAGQNGLLLGAKLLLWSGPGQRSPGHPRLGRWYRRRHEGG